MVEPDDKSAVHPLWGYPDHDVIGELINHDDMVGCRRHLRLLNKHWLSVCDGRMKSVSAQVSRPWEMSLKSILAAAAAKFECLSALDIRQLDYDNAFPVSQEAQGGDQTPTDGGSMDMPCLLELTCSAPRFDDINGLAELKELKKLTALRFYYPILSAPVFETLGSLMTLQELSLFGARIQALIPEAPRDNEAVPMGDMEMSIKDEDFVDTHLSCLTSLTGLKALDLGQTRVSDTGMCSLTTLVGLMELKLCSDRSLFESGDSSWLTHFRNLTTLDLSMTKASDTHLPLLNQLTKLQNLDLRGTRVKRVGESLMALEQLVHLNLARCEVIKTVVEEDMDPLVRMPSLRTLTVAPEESQSFESMDLGDIQIAIDHEIFPNARRLDILVDEEIDRMA